MKKGKVKCQINELIIEKECTINDDEIIFLDQDNNTIVYDFSLDQMIKSSNDGTITMSFGNNKGQFIYQFDQKEVKMDFPIIMMAHNNKKVAIKYQIENNDFNFVLEYEEC